MPQAGIRALMNVPLIWLPAAVERWAAAQGARGRTMTQTQVEVDLLNFTAWMDLGIALSDLGNFDEASEWLEAALQLQPDSPKALQNAGMNLSRQGRWGEAIAYYERAARLQPDNPVVHRSLASVLLGAGDYARGWPEHESAPELPAASGRADQPHVLEWR